MACAQSNPTKLYRLVFYNVENLFDTIDDPLTNDEEFTPSGDKKWNTTRYNSKLLKTSKVLLSGGNWDAPDIIGLAEIENRHVLEDLIHTPVLQKFSYEIAHFDSPDQRGIDVAVLYRSDRLELLHARPLRVSLSNDSTFSTRDILYTSLLLGKQDTLHLLSCHWPSRRGGQSASEHKRLEAARSARSIVDSLFGLNPRAQIVVMGDFNDEWFDLSLSKYLCASSDSAYVLNNLMKVMSKTMGSHRYRGKWAYLDQIIVSKALLDRRSLDVRFGQAKLIQHDFLLEEDQRYPGVMPYRTFRGPQYHAGFSDHLPVYIELELMKP